MDAGIFILDHNLDDGHSTFSRTTGIVREVVSKRVFLIGNMKTRSHYFLPMNKNGKQSKFAAQE